MQTSPQALPPLCSSILDAIGGTPLVELNRIKESLSLDSRLLAKCEHLNPGFSKKDRIALEMLREAKRKGELKPGQTVVELTSGNTGTGLALVCRATGHPFVAVISKGNTIERARMMQALGAEVIRVDQAPGSPSNQVSGEDLALVEERTRFFHSPSSLTHLSRGSGSRQLRYQAKSGTSSRSSSSIGGITSESSG